MQPYFSTIPTPNFCPSPAHRPFDRAQDRLTLSLDLDNVIRDQIGSIIAAVARRFCIGLTRDAFSCWDPPLGQALGIPNDEFTAWAWADPMIFAEARPMPGAVWALHRLARKNRLIITTATAWPQLTEPWLRRWNIPFNAIIHTTDKASVAFDWHVDDSPATLVKLSEAGRRVIRFALPWNAHLDTLRLHSGQALPSLADWRSLGDLL